MTENEKEILRDILDEEIKSYIDSGYNEETDDYIAIIKNIKRKMGLE